jgi:preprotein translocase subunit SecD
MCRVPPVADPGWFKNFLSSISALRLYNVAAGPYLNENAALQAYGGVLPLGTILLRTGGPAVAWYLLRDDPIAGTSDLVEARLESGKDGKWPVSCRFNAVTSKRLAILARQQPPGRLAAVLNDWVLDVQSIEPRIAERLEIHGLTEERTAAAVALLLSSGELPAGFIYKREKIERR